MYDEILNVENYVWFGNNRKNLHKHAWSGSGGVGCLVHKWLFNYFDVNVHNDSIEDILWLCLKGKCTSKSFYVCICYLPPKNSTRQVDVAAFYDRLLSNIYEYQNDGTIFICGDFNSRCGNECDYIEGVDKVPLRDVVDFVRNEYCDSFIEFLIDANFCMLNGRNFVSNDFTCIRPQGASVVDYCLVNHDDLYKFNDFKVVRSAELVNKVDFCPPTGVPDHSLLMWSVSHNFVPNDNLETMSKPDDYVKFLVDKIPGDFMQTQDIVCKLHDTINELEQGYRTQENIDHAYSSLCSTIKVEMHNKIPHKTIVYNSSRSNRKRCVGKPWWNEELTQLWNNVCVAG